jgi:hypothetical protein
VRHAVCIDAAQDVKLAGTSCSGIMATPDVSEGPELPPEMQAVPLRVLEVR